MQSTHMPKWPAVKEKHIKKELGIHLLFVLKLDDKCKIIKT